MRDNFRPKHQRNNLILIFQYKCVEWKNQHIIWINNVDTIVLQNDFCLFCALVCFSNYSNFHAILLWITYYDQAFFILKLWTVRWSNESRRLFRSHEDRVRFSLYGDHYWPSKKATPDNLEIKFHMCSTRKILIEQRYPRDRVSFSSDSMNLDRVRTIRNRQWKPTHLRSWR